MKMMAITAALALVLGASSAMARGLEVYERVGAFSKGGPGVEVRLDRSKAHVHSSIENVPAVSSADRSEPRAGHDSSAPHFAVNHVHH